MSPRADARARTVVVLAALVLAYAAAGAWFALHARPSIDEGKFLLAGRLVAEGQLPYRDFPSSQSPMLAYAYAAAPVVFDSPLLGGRALALAAGVAGLAGALWLAARHAGLHAALLTWLATLATLPSLAVAATVRSQSLATPLLVLGVAALALPRRGVLGWSLAPSLLLWSTGLRLTNAGVFVAVAWWTTWRLRERPRRLAGVAALVALQALVVTYPVWRAPGDAWFHVVEAQLGREARLEYVAPQAPGALARKAAGYAEQLPRAGALLAFGGALALSAALRVRRGWRPNLREPCGDAASAAATLAALGLLAFAPHLALSGAFGAYLVPLWALLAPAVGIGLARVVRTPVLRTALVVVLASLALLAAARQLPYYTGRGEEGFAAFHRSARSLGALGGPGCTMLTFETELALEAGCGVPPGLEYSLFSYFAHLPADEARRLGVGSRARLREFVREAPPELVVLAPGHATRLLGTERDPETGRALPPETGSIAPLDFLGPLAARYAPARRIVLPTSTRHPRGEGRVTARVYRRVEP